MKTIERFTVRLGWVRVSTMAAAVEAASREANREANREADRERAKRAALEDQLLILRNAPVELAPAEQVLIAAEKLAATRERSYALA